MHVCTAESSTGVPRKQHYLVKCYVVFKEKVFAWRNSYLFTHLVNFLKYRHMLIPGTHFTATDLQISVFQYFRLFTRVYKICCSMILIQFIFKEKLQEAITSTLIWGKLLLISNQNSLKHNAGDTSPLLKSGYTSAFLSMKKVNSSLRITSAVAHNQPTGCRMSVRYTFRLFMPWGPENSV